jgi:phage gp45-like
MRFCAGILLAALPACALQFEKAIPLPNVTGRIDHMTVDLRGSRLFVAALGNHTIEIVDLAAGKPAHRIAGLGEPQGLFYWPEGRKLFAADGADGSLRIYDSETYRLLETVAFSGDADNVRFDPLKKQVWVGYGEGALGVVDAATGRRVGDVKLAGHPESFQLERDGPRIFVNVPAADSIAVVDREKLAVIARWPLAGAAANFPMALAPGLVFAGCRRPAEVLGFDRKGARTVTARIRGDTDDLFYDGVLERLYVSCGEGYLDTLDLKGNLIESLPTAPGARTALFVPELGRLFLAVPARGGRSAEIRVYATRAARTPARASRR